jgi:hypothetical protein
MGCSKLSCQFFPQLLNLGGCSGHHVLLFLHTLAKATDQNARLTPMKLDVHPNKMAMGF